MVKQYIVKHGTDEYKELEVLSIVPARDFIGVQGYDFLHDSPQVGINFYQIVVEYEDGNIDYPMYGDIVFEEITTRIHIAPNPATDYLNIDLSNYMNESISYKLLSVNGVALQEGSWTVDHDKTVQLDLTNIRNGMYIIYMKAENQRAVAVKFVIAKDY